MGNPFRRIESPASTALQFIEAHRLFHLVTVIVHGKAMPCTSNMPSYVILCLLCHNKPTICHNLMSYYAYQATVPTVAYYAYCAIINKLCQLSHNKPTVCHTMFTRVPCYAYKCHSKLQRLLWHTMLTNTMPIFPLQASCMPYSAY